MTNCYLSLKAMIHNDSCLRLKLEMWDATRKRKYGYQPDIKYAWYFKIIPEHKFLNVFFFFHSLNIPISSHMSAVCQYNTVYIF
jgi:hypothetical protein